MSTLNSWIDSAEIKELLPFLLPEKGGRNAAKGVAETESADEGEVEVSAKESAEPESTAGPEEIVEVIDAREGVDSVVDETSPAETVSEPTPEVVPLEMEPALPAADSEIDFNTPDAYDAAAFPEEEGNSRNANGPNRQAAAVQASVALERARSRADEVGLLKGHRNGVQPAGTQAPESEKPAVVGLDEPPSIPTESEPESKSENVPASAETSNHEDSVIVEAEPGTFRYRLAHFAKSAVALTGGSNPAVTDFQSYPLYRARNGNRAASPQAVESILRMNRLVRDFPGPQNGDHGNTAQIALSDGRWLCLLIQDSASGGVCASLQVPAPVSDETAAELHHCLRAALTAAGD